MNILFLSEVIYPHGSGAQLATHLWTELLADSGYNIRVITNRFPNEPGRSIRGSAEIIRIPILRWGTMKYSVLSRIDILGSSLLKKAMAWADIVCVDRYWYSAILVAKAFRKPVITQLHDYAPICSLATKYDLSRNEICKSSFSCHPRCVIAHELNKNGKFLRTLASSTLNLVTWRYVARLVGLSDSILCVSKAQRDMILTHLPSLAKQIHVIYNPLPKLPLTKIKARDMGYFGGPNPLKGYHVLRFALRHVTHGVTIHATGFQVKATLQISGNSKMLLNERLPPNEYEDVHHMTKAILVPSVWAEPFSYVVAEAILRGRLIIASEVGGIPELVDGCPGAFLCRPGDERQLAELIDHVDGLDNQTASELAAENREVFLRKFDNKRIAQDFMHLLEKNAAS